MEATPYCLTVVLHFRPDAVDAALAHLRELAAASRQEPGCLGYNVHQNPNDLRQVMIYELYTNEAALKAHHETPHFERHAKNGIYNLVETRGALAYSPVSIGPIAMRA